MSFASRLYQSPCVQNQQTRASRVSLASQRLEEIRKKYDTPTRRDLKDMENRSPQCSNIRKSVLMDKPEPRPRVQKENMCFEEEDVFRKIKEMKESLLNKNYDDRIKVTKSIYEPRGSYRPELRDSKAEPRAYKGQPKDSYRPETRDIYKPEPRDSYKPEPRQSYKPEPRESYRQELKESKVMGPSYKNTNRYGEMVGEHRVENIDKINSKIQHILSCLRETDASNVQGQKERERSRVKLDDSKCSSYAMSRDVRQASMIIEKNRVSLYEKERMTTAESPISKIEATPNRSMHIKTRSFTNSTLINGKGRKWDDQISKIEEKIHQCEEEKRRLGVEFKPYSYSQSKSSASLTRSFTAEKFYKPSARLETAKSSLQQELESREKRLSNSRNASMERIELIKQRVSKPSECLAEKQESKGELEEDEQIPSFRLKVRPLEDSNTTKDLSREQEEFRKNKEQDQIRKNREDQLRKNREQDELRKNREQDDFRKKADQGIESRRRKLAYETSRDPKKNIKSLVERLCKQVELDEKLRNYKLWFDSLMDSDKWLKLAQNSKLQTLSLGSAQIKSKFSTNDEENNPFFSVRDSEGSIEELVDAYLASQSFWNDSIAHGFSKSALREEDFNEQLDLEKKGYIVLEDIVRFLNMQTGTFFRNRDLFLIFKRLCEQEKMQFNELLDIIGSESI